MLKPSYLYKPHKMTRFMTIKHKGFKSDIYSMIDTKNGNVVGEMIARPVTIRDYFYHYSPNAHTYTSFFIDRLQVFVKNVGIGSIFINIAKKESIRRFCSGNVHLISKNIQNPIDVPHGFYIKKGFKCNKYHQSSQKYIEECIKSNNIIDPKITTTQIPMYIEKCVINQEENINHWYKFKIKFPHWFNNL